MPDIPSLIKNPKTVVVPEEPSLLFAICGALVQQANRKNFGQILNYAERIPPEFLGKIQKIASTARAYHYENPLPWMDKAGMLLPDGALIHHQYENMEAEAIYASLQQDKTRKRYQNPSFGEVRDYKPKPGDLPMP